jgi:transposase
MRLVPVKSATQQALLMLHRVRDQLIGQLTATVNALRGHLAELGIVVAQRQAGLRQLLAALGEVEDDRIPPLAREVLQMLVAHLRELADRIAGLDRRLVALAHSDAICRSLSEVPGIGPVIATALVATVPDATSFRSGRHLAAWLGLVPLQHASGGKPRRLGLSKRGDGYLRRQLIHGARPLVRVSPGRTGKPWAWINGLRQRRPFNVVVAAVANKLARIIWAMLSRGEAYRPVPVRGSHRGQRPTSRTKGRMDGSSQDHRATTSKKPLRSGRRPWMDHRIGTDTGQWLGRG